jgi:hypothetical protein
MTSTSSVSSAIPTLPNPVVENIIFPNLSLPALGACSSVCKVWREMAKKHICAFSYEKAFGPKEWYTYLGGHVRNVPRFPSNISEILNSPCPFWPAKKVHETHILVLVPETVGGQPLTLKTLGELVKKPLIGNATKYDSFDLGDYTDSPAPSSHWVLMTRDVIEGSCNKSYIEQQALLEKQVVYEVPHILDATICIFMEYIRSGTMLYSNSPLTYTRCQEKWCFSTHLVVGSFTTRGLNVFHCYGGTREFLGSGGCRKFEAIGH